MTGHGGRFVQGALSGLFVHPVHLRINYVLSLGLLHLLRSSNGVISQVLGHYMNVLITI